MPISLGFWEGGCPYHCDSGKMRRRERELESKGLETSRERGEIES